MITQKLLVFLLLVTSIPISYTRHTSLWGKLIFPDDIIVENHNSHRPQNQKSSENKVEIQNNNAEEVVTVNITERTVNPSVDVHRIIENFENDYSEIIEVDMRNNNRKILDQSNPEINIVNTSVEVQHTPIHQQNREKIMTNSEKIIPQVQIVNNSEVQVCDTLECQIYAETVINSINKTMDPCEDFYEYACGKWGASNPVPPYRLVWHPFVITDDTTHHRLKEILESKVEPTEILPMRQAKQWYQSCMDTERREQRGIEPIKSIMMQIGGWPMAMDEDKWNETQYTWQDVENYFTRLMGSYTFYDISVPTKIVGNLSAVIVNAPELPLTGTVAGGLRNFIKNKYDRYQLLISKTAEIFATSNGATIPKDRLSREAEELVLFEKAIFELKNVNSSAYGTRLYKLKNWYHSNKTNSLLGNPKSNIDWSSVIQDLFDLVDIKLHRTTFVQIKNKGYIRGINDLLKRTPRRTIVNYIHWNFVGQVFAFTNQYMREEFIGRLWDVLFNLEAREPRWMRCVKDMKLKHAAAYAYVEKYFPQNIKSSAQEMVENIRGSLEQTIDSSNWMDLESKKLSKERLNQLTVFVGFPNWYNKTAIIDYYKGITAGAEYFENNLNWLRFEKAYNLKLYVTPRPLLDPFMYPGEEPTVAGATYRANLNTAQFPAVAFAEQFFGIGLPSYVNYGKVGFLMGHEMGHAYDTCGFTFGNNGKKNQLSNATLTSFYERVDCFVNQYDEYHDNPTVENSTNWKCNAEDHNDDKSDGQKTAAENIADATSLEIVFQAYKKLSKQKNPNGEMRLPGLEEFTADQLFFLSFAGMWCETEAPSYAAIRSYTEHPQMSLRVLGPLSNSNDFAKAFNCPTDSWMNPSQKCSIWNKPSD